MRRKLLSALAVLPGLLLLSAPIQGGGKAQKVDDQTFVKKAAQGGMAEVMLGKLAEQKAASADIKKFGTRMVTDHGKANKELIAICVKEKFDVPKEIGKEHKEIMDKLAKLSGAEFDREYMLHMVKDHEEDAAEFADASKSLKNEELRKFAAKTLPVIQEHLKLAKQISGNLKAAAK
jgi:putative membrane protein